MKYFDEKGIILLNYHEELVEMIERMFARLKWNDIHISYQLQYDKGVREDQWG